MLNQRPCAKYRHYGMYAQPEPHAECGIQSSGPAPRKCERGKVRHVRSGREFEEENRQDELKHLREFQKRNGGGEAGRDYLSARRAGDAARSSLI